MQQSRICIVMICEGMDEAAAVSEQLLQVNSASLITYRRAEDVYLNGPAGRVALIILAGTDGPAAMGKTLQWMQRRWPRCPVYVVGDDGGNEMERAARQGGAAYLTRPVGPVQWASVLAHVLGAPQGATPRPTERDALTSE
jgi:hypothetical protein